MWPEEVVQSILKRYGVPGEVRNVSWSGSTNNLGGCRGHITHKLTVELSRIAAQDFPARLGSLTSTTGITFTTPNGTTCVVEFVALFGEETDEVIRSFLYKGQK